MDTSSMDKTKKGLIIAILRFLQNEAQSNDRDQKESLEVAMQCIESAFDVDLRRDGKDNLPPENLLDIYAHRLERPQMNMAETYKNSGNEMMRNGLYTEAAEAYSRAIQMNPYNAIYYCNRAAAFSRLEYHEKVIEDCQSAVRLDPTYGKAYGRLGIAYSNLNMFIKAREAYIRALELDPTNTMYQENLRLAIEKIGIGSGDAPCHPDSPELNMANSNLINMASQILSDPSVRDVMTGILQMGNEGNPNIEALLNMGQRLAHQMQIDNPGFVDTLRRQFTGDRPPGDDTPAAAAAPAPAPAPGDDPSNTGDTPKAHSPSKDDNASS